MWWISCTSSYALYWISVNSSLMLFRYGVGSSFARIFFSYCQYSSFLISQAVQNDYGLIISQNMVHFELWNSHEMSVGLIPSFPQIMFLTHVLNSSGFRQHVNIFLSWFHYFGLPHICRINLFFIKQPLRQFRSFPFCFGIECTVAFWQIVIFDNSGKLMISWARGLKILSKYQSMFFLLNLLWIFIISTGN